MPATSVAVVDCVAVTVLIPTPPDCHIICAGVGLQVKVSVLPIQPVLPEMAGMETDITAVAAQPLPNA